MLKPCYIWKEGYQVNLLGKPDDPTPAKLANLAAKLVEELWPVVQPLTLGAEFSCFDPAEYFNETGQFLPLSFYYVYQNPVPPYVRLRGYSQVDQESAIPAITPGLVKIWLEQGISQVCSQGNGLSGLKRLEMYGARVKLVSKVDTDPFALLAFPDGPYLAEIPVEDRSDGQWVSAPLKEHVFNPAITYTIFHQFGALSAQVVVHWSWWFESGTAEFTALQQALRRICTGEWQYQATENGADNDLYGLTNH